MNTTTKILAISGATAGLLALGAVAYAASTDHGWPWEDGNGRMHRGAASAPVTTADTAADTTVDGASVPAQVPSGTVAAATGTLDDTERDALLYMVEEEKLAHDVYVTLGEQWNVQIFTNIANSESRHVESVQTLLATYGVADPTVGNGVGEFTDPAFVALYDELVQQGSESLESAMAVGVAIEELDIADLQARLETTDQADIVTVYEHLLAASQHHLAAFQGDHTGTMDGSGSHNGGTGGGMGGNG